MKRAYVRALGRLLTDIETGAGNDAIAVSLAAAVRQSRPRGVTIRVTDDVLTVDDEIVAPIEAPELAALLVAFERHGVRSLAIRVGVTTRELLQLAASLAVRDIDESHASVFEAAQRLGFWHVSLEGDARDAAEISSAPTTPRAITLGSADETTAGIASLRAAIERAIADKDARETFDSMYYMVRCAKAASEAAVEALQAVASSATIGASAESVAEVEEAMQSAVARSVQWRESLSNAVSQPALMLIGELLEQASVPREQVIAVLRETGDEGTGALMHYLIAAPSLVQRRVYFDAIVEVGVGVPVLIGHLGHSQWFVVRNAASLLGAMRATSADGALIATLAHVDERVRMSVATALVQIGTQTGRRALEGAIGDASSEVRRRALRGLLSADGLARSAAVLSEALDLERDPDVQLEAISALRAIGTRDAGRQLLKLCSAAGSAGKGVAFRKSALDALVELSPTAAQPLLRILAQDRDPELREFAATLLHRVTQAA